MISQLKAYFEEEAEMGDTNMDMESSSSTADPANSNSYDLNYPILFFDAPPATTAFEPTIYLHLDTSSESRKELLNAWRRHRLVYHEIWFESTNYYEYDESNFDITSMPPSGGSFKEMVLDFEEYCLEFLDNRLDELRWEFGQNYFNGIAKLMRPHSSVSQLRQVSRQIKRWAERTKWERKNNGELCLQENALLLKMCLELSSPDPYAVSLAMKRYDINVDPASVATRVKSLLAESPQRTLDFTYETNTYWWGAMRLDVCYEYYKSIANDFLSAYADLAPHVVVEEPDYFLAAYANHVSQGVVKEGSDSDSSTSYSMEMVEEEAEQRHWYPAQWPQSDGPMRQHEIDQFDSLIPYDLTVPPTIDEKANIDQTKNAIRYMHQFGCNNHWSAGRPGYGLDSEL